VIAKHGNRSVSSQCGSADVLRELGVNIEASPETVGRCLDEIGIGFLFAPALHPAMKHAAGPRRELKLRTVFNLLGPLTNPAGATRQLMGVYDASYTEPLAVALAGLGAEHALVVHGLDGLDEVSTIGETQVSEARGGEVTTYRITPEQFGITRATPDQLVGGEPEPSARMLRATLEESPAPGATSWRSTPPRRYMSRGSPRASPRGWSWRRTPSTAAPRSTSWSGSWSARGRKPGPSAKPPAGPHEGVGNDLRRDRDNHPGPGTENALAGLRRVGIPTDSAIGVPLWQLRRIAKQIPTDHALAQELWETGLHEAMLLAPMVDDPALVTPEQAEAWAADLNSWGLCDQLCANLLDRTPFAAARRGSGSAREPEFVKRAGFALMAALAVHDKAMDEERLIEFLEDIEREAGDDRHYVKKAVNWALRQIGKRSPSLNTAAVAAARRIGAQDARSARWIASDALRELTGDAVQGRLRRRKGV